MNIIITGTSRGIGLELCRQGVTKGHKILAVARNPEQTSELKALGVETLAVELTDDAAPEKIAGAAAAWPHVDLLLNNAGIYRPDESPKDFADTFRVNTTVPFFMTRALLPHLKKSSAPKAVHISSLMGSVADNGSGGAYSYRASKAALNAINKSFAIDQKWLTTIVMHPGWVQTDMGGQNATLKIPDSAAGIWKVIEGLTPAKTGKFFDYKGAELPW